MTDQERIEKIETCHSHLLAIQVSLADTNIGLRFPSDNIDHSIGLIAKAKRELEIELDKLKQKL